MESSNFYLRISRYLYRGIFLRNRYFFMMDLFVLLAIPSIALILRTDTIQALDRYGPGLFIYTLCTVTLRLLIFYQSDLYRRYWRYASISELMQIVSAVSLSSFLIIGLYFAIYFASRAFWTFPNGVGLPRSIPLIDSLLTMYWVCGSRLSIRLFFHWWRNQTKVDMVRVAIMGAGEAGHIILREMQHNAHLNLMPVIFLDDDPRKQGLFIHGLPVRGNRHDIPRLVHEYGIDQLLIAMPTASGKDVREIITICEKAGVATKTIPGLYELLGGALNISKVRDVEIADLLRREPIRTDTSAVTELLTGKRVLITGGGGSIGSELCRQILRTQPAHLTVLGHGENSVFEIHQELQKVNAEQGNKTQIETVIADIRMAERVRNVFKKQRPQIVFHAAAHKHVPLMELNPTEAMDNNVLGTRNVLKAAQSVDVERFVMISSDKAVNPTNIMGASKRVAELLVHQAGKQSGRPYVAVRFGNVLGSRGSVVLTFKKQIAQGGPVTITHPDMVRYFMTIPEAVQLVLQASVLGSGGEVFLLDMGDPVKIADLARDLIELSGLKVGRDIDIEYSGIRPGEKLFEELFVKGEEYKRTKHEKIMIAENASSFVPLHLDEVVDALSAATLRDDEAAIRRSLQNLVPEYQPDTNGVSSRSIVAVPSVPADLEPLRKVVPEHSTA